MKEVPSLDKDTQEIARMFDEIAPTYDGLNRGLSLGLDKLWRRQLVRKAKALSPMESILDIACGTGDLTIELSKLRPERIVGIDIASKMLEIGRKKVASKGLNSLVSLQQSSALALPYPADSFDLVTCAFGVRNFESLDKGLQEIRRVLKANGSVFILEFSLPKQKLLLWGYQFYFKMILPLIGRLFSRHNKAYSYLPASVSQFPYGEKFVQVLKKNGFVCCKCLPLTKGIVSLYFGKVVYVESDN